MICTLYFEMILFDFHYPAAVCSCGRLLCETNKHIPERGQSLELQSSVVVVKGLG